MAGIRLADLRGYSYDRRDVTARSLANAYAQTLGAIFTEQQKPYEVEVCVAEVGVSTQDDQIYRLTYDGTIVDEPDFLVMGGQAETLTATLRSGTTSGLTLANAVGTAVRALGSVGGEAGAARTLAAASLEVAVLDRTRTQRTFKRITGAALSALLPSAPAELAEPGASEQTSATDGPDMAPTS